MFLSWSLWACFVLVDSAPPTGTSQTSPFLDSCWRLAPPGTLTILFLPMPRYQGWLRALRVSREPPLLSHHSWSSLLCIACIFWCVSFKLLLLHTSIQPCQEFSFPPNTSASIVAGTVGLDTGTQGPPRATTPVWKKKILKKKKARDLFQCLQHFITRTR